MSLYIQKEEFVLISIKKYFHFKLGGRQQYKYWEYVFDIVLALPPQISLRSLENKV